jgi:hypothetical protein
MTAPCPICGYPIESKPDHFECPGCWSMLVICNGAIVLDVATEPEYVKVVTG